MLRNPDESQALLEPTDEQIAAEFNGVIIDNYAVANPEAKLISPARIRRLTLAVKQMHDEVMLRKRNGYLSGIDAYTIAKASREYARNAAYAQSDAEEMSYRREYLKKIDPIINKHNPLRPLAFGVTLAGFALVMGAGLPVAISMGVASALIDGFGFWPKLTLATRTVVPAEAERRDRQALSTAISRTTSSRPRA